MKNASRFLLLTALCAAAEAAPQPVLCIHLYNRQAAAPLTIERLKSQVTHLFAAAKIATVWEESPADSEEAFLLDPSNSPTGSLRSSDRPCLVVRIVPDVPNGAYRNALGFALPFARSGVDVEAIYDRIESTAKRARVEVDVVLAYVVAHEIGHVLLQSGEHAPAGIMRAYCDSDQFRLASFGVAGFLPDEAQRLRKRLSPLHSASQAAGAEP